MSPRRGPTLRAQWLGQQLRDLRDGAELQLRDAGDYIQRDASTISRMEAGLVPPRLPDLWALLNLYGVDDGDLRERLEQLNREVWQKGWWDGFARDVPSSLMDYTWLEERARQIRSFDPLVIPGLLQTRDYANSMIRAAHPAAPPAQIKRWVEFRITRQKVLDQDDPPRLTSVVDEGVLRRVVGGPEVMTAQLAHLLELASRPTLELRILPASAGAHASPDGMFVVVRMPEPYPDVVYVETAAGSIYVEWPETEQFTQKYYWLTDQALDADESLKLVSAILDNLE